MFIDVIIYIKNTTKLIVTKIQQNIIYFNNTSDDIYLTDDDKYNDLLKKYLKMKTNRLEADRQRLYNHKIFKEYYLILERKYSLNSSK